MKNKVTAGLFGILLGGFCAHKFYLGNVGLGIVYLLFCCCLLYTSDAADDRLCGDFGGRRIIKKKKTKIIS